MKRCHYDGVRLDDLFIGGSINVFSRQLNIVDYADEFTRRALTHKRERTFGLCFSVAQFGTALTRCLRAGMTTTRVKSFQLSRDEAQRFASLTAGTRADGGQLAEALARGTVVAFELLAGGAVAQWNSLRDPTSTYGSANDQDVDAEIDFFFGPRMPARSTAQFDNCTLCVIKPHLVLAGQSGEIIDGVMAAGFKVSALEMFHLERANAEEFLEVYKGVVPEYNSMVMELISGPCIALEVVGNAGSSSAVQDVRTLVGPADPEIARHLRPQCLRAKFGVDKIKNSLHCTDLPEDGALESEYFFKILQGV